MRIKPRRGSWILAVLFAFVFAFPSSSKATSEPGLQVTIYDNYGYNGSPPLPSVSGRPVQCTTTYLNIDQDFGNSICGLYDDYIVKYEGYITSPTTETITFYPSADDGTKLYIDDVLVDNNWIDKGGGGNPSTPIDFIAGVPKPITLWFYENGGGNWVELAWNQGGGYSTVPAEAFTQNNESQYTTTTTAAPYLNSVTNLVATANADGSVDLDWDAPTSSNVDIYAYGVTFYGLDEIGGTTSGGWGVWTNQGTTYSLAEYMFSGTTGFGPVRFGIKAGNESCFSSDGVGPCIYGPETNVDVIVIDPTPPPTTTTTEPTTTTTEPTTTTTTEPELVLPPVETLPTENTTVSIPELDLSPVSIPEPENTTVSIPELDLSPVSVPEIDTSAVTVPEPEDLPNETIPEVSIPEETQNTAEETVTDIFDNTDNADEFGAAVTNAIGNADSPEEIAALVTSLFDGPMNSEEFTAVVDAVFTENLSAEELSAALDAVFTEPLSDEKFAEVIDAVLDSPLTDEQFAEVVNILESDNITEDQVADAVDNILENGVTEDQATELATSEKVLESIDGDQASEIFAEIPVGELTQEEESALVEAVTNAPEEVKNAFEETINVYGEGLDDYVPVGSSVDVGSRRTLLAATAVLSAATVGVAGSAGPSGGSGGGSGGGSKGPSGGSGSSGGGPGDGGNLNSRREDENPDGEDEEQDTEIEGPEGDEEENNFTRNSIFKYQEGTMIKKFSPWGFIKKFSKETAALAFTISGSVVVFATLSGETRKITIIATGCAFLVHYINAMLKKDE
jgi:hypothetical protein